jgi:hypothetical protein
LDNSEELPSLKELRDLSRQDFRGDREAIDEIELTYGELLTLRDSETRDGEAIKYQTKITEEIAGRKGVKESVRLRALDLLQELYDYQ